MDLFLNKIHCILYAIFSGFITIIAENHTEEK